MDHRPVLYDRQAKAGSPAFFGVALVHPVEPLKDSLLLIRWNPNAGVCHDNLLALQRAAYPDA